MQTLKFIQDGRTKLSILQTLQTLSASSTVYAYILDPKSGNAFLQGFKKNGPVRESNPGPLAP